MQQAFNLSIIRVYLYKEADKTFSASSLSAFSKIFLYSGMRLVSYCSIGSKQVQKGPLVGIELGRLFVMFHQLLTFF